MPSELELIVELYEQDFMAQAGRDQYFLDSMAAAAETAHDQLIENNGRYFHVAIEPGDMTHYEIIGSLRPGSRDFWVGSNFSKLQPWSPFTAPHPLYAVEKWGAAGPYTGRIVGYFLALLTRRVTTNPLTEGADT